MTNANRGRNAPTYAHVLDMGDVLFPPPEICPDNRVRAFERFAMEVLRNEAFTPGEKNRAMVFLEEAREVRLHYGGAG